MIFNPKIFTIDEIQSLLDAAKLALLQGQTVVTWSSLGSSATMQILMHPLQVIRECTLYLQQVDPITYGKPVKVGRVLHQY